MKIDTASGERHQPREAIMKIQKDIDTTCLQVLGCLPDPQHFRTTWSAVRMLVKVHGSAAVVRTFQEWARTQVGKPIKFPVSDFVRIAPGLLAGTRLGCDNRLQTLLNGLTAAGESNVLFDAKRQEQLQRLLEEGYEAAEILAVFREYYAKIDSDYDLRFAAKTFCESSRALVEARRRVLRQQAEMEAMGRRIEAEIEREAAERSAAFEKQQQEEAELSELDPFS